MSDMNFYLLDQTLDMNHIVLMTENQEHSFDFYLMKLTSLNYYRKTLK